ncbi:hypothetical protein EIP91_003535 [Steccherinum ochraceum]|uniref:Cyclochlorotine biosynthesis protein O n=1 Tax=Steccherinum ochraceum TaxID=92696 RepID=A0A4R0RIU4_9APHY|nr:hypothetical protein EIP91_003535 [Steccherinum ochraceum]
MDKQQQYYEPLLGQPPTGEDGEKTSLVDEPSRRTSRGHTIFWVVFVLQSLAVICLSILLAKDRSQCSVNPVYPQVLYSPAQEVLEYQPKTFSMGFGKTKTIYQGEPSQEVDKAWNDLYNNFGLSKIPKEQARLLPNKTLPIPGDEQYYAIGLAVFHQLHCLNILRQGLYPEHYRDPVTGAIGNIPAEDWPDHVSHCIDNLRQSLMCAADISLVVWQWVEEDNRASIMMNTVHSCRNYDKIADWAKRHRRTTHFDSSIHVEDDIVIPSF